MSWAGIRRDMLIRDYWPAPLPNWASTNLVVVGRYPTRTITIPDSAGKANA